MKITDLSLHLLRVPLKTPFKTALRTVEAVEDVVVALRTDTGHVGHGEAPPTPPITGDTRASIVEAIRAHIAPRLIGRDVGDLDGATALVQGALARNPSAKAAVEIALYDLWGQLHGAPLYALLGGARSDGGAPVLFTDITISVDGVDKMVADALSAVARGYPALKLKLGKGGVDTDLARVRAIHAAVGGRALLRLDANQGWTAEQSVAVMHALEADGIALDLLEQPVPAHDIDGLRYVTERVRTPVMADESAFDPRQAAELMACGAADIVNIKLMKAGGISQALRIADLAAARGVPCMMGCMLESSISVAAAAHVAAARAGTITRLDLDGPALCAFDPVEGGATFRESEIVLSKAPGLGIRAIRGLESLSR